MCPQKNKVNYFLATKRCNFWLSDLRDNYEYGYRVFHLTSVMPIPGINVSDMLHFSDKPNGQTVKPHIQKFSALTEHAESL